jgi:hypothetical protein
MMAKNHDTKTARKARRANDLSARALMDAKMNNAGTMNDDTNMPRSPIAAHAVTGNH